MFHANREISLSLAKHGANALITIGSHNNIDTVNSENENEGEEQQKAALTRLLGIECDGYSGNSITPSISMRASLGNCEIPIAARAG